MQPVDLAGPLGGALAAAFAAGATAAYAFAILNGKERLLELKERLAEEKAECHAECDRLRAQIVELQRIALGQKDRQLEQIRDSSINLLEEEEAHGQSGNGNDRTADRPRGRFRRSSK